MTYQGHYENGVVVLDELTCLKDGVRVRIEVITNREASERIEDKPSTPFEHYQSIIGGIEDLPQDFAAQHDHYIHGTPKK